MIERHAAHMVGIKPSDYENSFPVYKGLREVKKNNV
jgi:hypothetical protein